MARRKNPLDDGDGGDRSDPSSIENMPGYVPPKQRKNWTPAEHCKFANDQLEWRGINRARQAKSAGPVRWVVSNGAVVPEHSATQ